MRSSLGVATQDRDLKLTSDKFLNVPWGIGIRKGEAAMKRWVNAALRYMKRKDEFVRILSANAPARLVGRLPQQRPAAEEHVRVSGRQGPDEHLSVS